jgi:hypothetical protein
MNTETIFGTCGSIDERGFINSLDRKGFTYPKCGAELIANICDAHSSDAYICVGEKKIYLIDNGIGMDVKGIGNMFATFKENHSDDKSMGVSGFGSKPALYILSKKNEKPLTVYLYTHAEEKEYIKATIPFNEMKETGCYTGMIKYSQMTGDEIAKFVEDRNGNKTGTTIEWEYSEKTHEYFKKQFYNSKQMEMNDRLDCIFGKTRLNLYYKDYELSKNAKLELYDYFSGERPEYYTGIKEDIIEHWIDKDNNDCFIWENEGKEFEFKTKSKSTKTVGTKPEEVKSKIGWTKEGFYLLKNGMRRDISLFDDNNPEYHTKTDAKTGKTSIIYGNSSASSELSEYENKFFDVANREEIKETLAKLQIIRNNQCVTSLELDGFKISSSRGGPDAYMKTVLHRTELSYETKSCQDNRMDIAMGIQENKNQHSNELPKNLMRLISHIKTKRYEEIIEYFKFKCEDKFKKMEIELERERENKRIADLEKERIANLEKERIANLEKERIERERIADLEKERIANLDKERIAELEKENKRIADLERENKRIADLENKRIAELENEKENERIAELENEKENERIAELERERLAELEKEQARLAELERIAKPRKLTESTQIRITVKHGIELLKQIQNSNDVTYEDTIVAMITSYLENSTVNDMKFVLKFVTFSEKMNCLLQLIETRYQGNTDSDMKEGSRLYKMVNV